ncbi:MAG: alkaline phosphatase D family protein [Acidimicrobiales bacterium]|nr:alkaline phosphatase D family protein [Acidimicrobiales bacterium]
MDMTPLSGMTRRRFLGGLAAAGVAGVAAGCTDDATSPAAPSGTVGDPARWQGAAGPAFGLGVASGDPTPTSVVLWTRVDPDGGTVPSDPVDVRWAIATDEAFAAIVAEGTAVAEPATAHSVHVRAEGLEPATTYWYRFGVGDERSRVGRTRTVAAAGSDPDRVRLGVASCQAYQSGYFTAYRALTEADLDAVVFLGDFIYELEGAVDVRPHGMVVPSTVEAYRAFYELNLRDPDLQDARAAHPWIVTWDDHEVEDNYADGLPGKFGVAQGETPESFVAKRAAAYEAWWEHMPVAVGPPVDGALEIYRGVDWGEMVQLSVLDTRQHRSAPPEAGTANLPRQFGGGPRPPEAFAEDATMLGADQEAWLGERLRTGDARWTVLAQQSILAPVNRLPDQPGGGYSMDSWDGYVAARRRLIDAVVDAGRTGAVTIGGDLHTSVVADVHRDPDDPTSPVVLSELIGPSISARETLQDAPTAGARSNAHIRLYDIEHRGVLIVTFTADAARAEFVHVDATVPDAPPTAGPTYQIDAGTPGARAV